MFREYDLTYYISNVNKLLNDPCLRLISMDITCSVETGATIASLRLKPCPKRETKFNRYLSRYLVEREEPLLDDLLKNKSIRLIKQYTFPSEEGTIVVLDYQTKKEGRSSN